MDSTLNPDVHLQPHVHANPNARMAAVRSVRSWRNRPSRAMRVIALMAPIAAVLACCFLAFGDAQARVQIDYDPMRPAPQTAAPATAGLGGAAPDSPAAAPAMPTLKITRTAGSGAALSALVDDTWVRRGDVVAGYRVTALRTESIDLVSVAEPALRLTLRLNPVAVERHDPARPPPSWPPLALEKKP
jgi:hypothetical protein